MKSLVESSRHKRYLRILPILFFLYIVNFLDRVNISYAIDAHMFQYLGVPTRQVGIIASLASSLFFIGYFIPQIFSNLGINRYGVRKIFLAAFTVWGIITILTGFVSSVSQVYVLRFLLGIAEGPFFAGVMFYLSLWFLKPERATANSFFTAAIPVSGIFGGLIAGAIFATYGDYPGWRYLFIYEGILAIIGGILAYFILTDFPKDAKWLSNEEKIAIQNAFKEEETEKVNVKWTKALTNRDVIILAIVYFLGVTSLYGYSIWLPSIISSFGKVNATVASFLSVIPYVIASISLIFIAHLADRTQRHRSITSIVFIIAGVGLGLSALTQNIFVLSFIFFAIAAIGIYSFIATFWAVPQKFLHGDAAAAAIGLINAVGNLGGIVGPIVVGFLKSFTGSFIDGVYMMALFSFLAGLVILLIRRS
ncbi:MFS transporter [Saccharolobus solfataricus]|uniref:Membrane transporter n=2 Tax=Saccharolobus solfataricus TaxID=2287 RepID=Q97Y43_SACS2|nr:MFS transporter [Saccharolobus solfataricus]AAK41728.1 Membrane transporter [Saccharolobus solfataricus P2]QPG48865.1 MFS transporter [Saccharolobus solfataricus]SAI85163.1 MFS transporter [Saccharolobus solfataricus]